MAGITRLTGADIVCPLCGKKSKYKKLADRNDDYDEHFAFHSDCIKEKVKKDNSPIDALRMLNVPYIDMLWKKSEDEADSYEVITNYLKSISPRPQYRAKRFVDSQFGDDETEEKNFIVTNEIIARWGANLPKDEYLVMEAKFKDLISLVPPKTTMEEKRYITNVKMSQKLDQALEEGSPKDIRDMQQVYANDLKDIGLNISAISDKNKERSFGERIGRWEENAPTPEISEEFKDVDNIGKYIQTFFMTPIKQLFGEASEEEISSQGLFSKDDIPDRDSE